MQFKGKERLPASPEVLWDVLFDEDVIAATIPGCRSLRKAGEDRYEGIIEVRMGVIEAVFDATFTVSDRVAPRQYQLLLEAEGMGASVKAVTRVELEPEGADASTLSYVADVSIGGGLGLLAGRLLGDTLGETLVRQGMADLKRKIEQKVA